MEAFLGLVVLLYSLSCSALRLDASPFPSDSLYSLNINMPDVTPHESDAYLCTAKKLNPDESFIVQYEPDADNRIAHHMLLFGCKNLHNKRHLYPNYWNCAHGDMCNHMTIMYGWAKNAPSMTLPPNVGFPIGGNSSIQYIVLQIHYANPLPNNSTDNSGLKLHVTSQKQKYVVGIQLLLANVAVIPPHYLKYHVDVNCKFSGSYTIHPFAYRVHTHKLGVVVSGYSFNPGNITWTYLAKGNPQWPQAFYPIQRILSITSNDVLAARCTYNSSEMNLPVKIGASSNNEMCNLYLMYYTEYRNMVNGQTTPPCIGVEYWDLVGNLPPGNDVPLPPNPEMEQQAYGYSHHPPIVYGNLDSSIAVTASGNAQHTSLASSQMQENSRFQKNNEFMYREVPSWPSAYLNFGQVAAVFIDTEGNVAIFHRANHVWNDLTFDVQNKYKLADAGPIAVDTVLILDSVTGLILKQWGSNMFYMPHGLYVHNDGSFWVTDVALHQVFHFSPSDLTKPRLSLGEKFLPGDDQTHFCKPSSVAVSKNGDIYVADGYCNSRIVRFTSDGKFLNQWGKQDDAFEGNPPVGSFRIPHKVTLLEDLNLACVADRENGRIQCFAMVTGRFRFQIQREEFGGTLYSIAYSREKGLLFAICGEAIYMDHIVKAFVFNITDQSLINAFIPQTQTFTRPHDIAVFPNGEEVFVCEIGPNVVWKFLRVSHKSTKKVLDTSDHTTMEGQNEKHEVHANKEFGDQTLKHTEEELTNFQTSLVILSILAIPVLCLVIITVVIRLKKKGKLQHCYLGHLRGWWGGYKTPHPQEKFNLGNLLNPRKGFDRVSMEESDGEGDEVSDSDLEEFSVVAKKT